MQQGRNSKDLAHHAIAISLFIWYVQLWYIRSSFNHPTPLVLLTSLPATGIPARAAASGWPTALT